VLIDHTLELTPQLGSLGVALFFVISGFLMHNLNKGKEGLSQSVEFVKSRLRRIYPMLLFSTVFTFSLVLLGKIGNHSMERFHYFESIPYVLSGLPNLFGLIPGNPADLPQAFIPLWSIGVELQFYFLIASLIALKKFDFKTTKIFYYLILLALLSHYLVLQVTGDLSFWTMPFTYVELFCFGIVMSMRDSSSFTKTLKRRPEFLYINLIVVLAFLNLRTFESLEDFKGFGYSIFAIFAMAIFYLGLHFGVGILSNPTINWLASRSYSIYLMHFPIRTIMMENVSLEISTFQSKLLTLALSLMVSEITYRTIETRFWKPKSI
jgi:peptidoglycan/LPS O-acetylase OafA/YrhL